VSHVPVLFAVTDDRVLALPDFFARARALALGPAVALVIRSRAAGGSLLRLADRLLAQIATSGTRVLIHDRVDVARLAGAAGVHLPAYGLPVAAVRQHLGPSALLGRSTHTPAEAIAALAEGADYVFLGNIWGTATHPGQPSLGIAAIRAATHGMGGMDGMSEIRGIGGMPGQRENPVQPAIIAIGGVTPERAREARAAGAHGVAAVRALWDAPDPAAAARGLLLSFRQ
jgi:thiamine-phosphate pyrophosphorylase